MSENRKQYYQKNKEMILQKVKEYKSKHKDKYKELDKIRHDKIMFGGNKKIVLERDNFQCSICKLNQQQHIVLYGYGLIVHHKDGNGKNSKNPNNNIDNLITLCRKCHTSHHNKERIGIQNPNHKDFARKKISEKK